MPDSSSDTDKSSYRYQRVLLKLSGEALMGDKPYGIDQDAVVEVACQIADVLHHGKIELVIVIGAGNIFRGVSAAADIEPTVADTMGMLATVINALALQSALENQAIPTRVLSAIPMDKACEPYIRRRAIRHLEKGRVVICAGGTGNPFCTTDSAAALRGSELNCELVMKATKVDGVYDSDPLKNPQAQRFSYLSYQQAVERQLKVMDLSAIVMCQENQLPIMVFSMFKKGEFSAILQGEGNFTLISEQTA